MKFTAALAAIVAVSHGQPVYCLLKDYECSTDPSEVACCTGLICDSNSMTCQDAPDATMIQSSSTACTENTDCESYQFCNSDGICQNYCSAEDDDASCVAEENCMGEGGYCMYGQCCQGNVCNSETLMCEAQASSEANGTCLAEKDPCANNTHGCCDGLWCNLWAMECQKMEDEVRAVAEQLIQ